MKVRKDKNALIMMVDDEPIMMEIVQAHLEEAGYSRFISVEDSSKAFDVLAHQRPDILFLDLVMPEVSGFDVLERIRAHQEFAYLPVIVLTSSSDSFSKLRALEIGATDFLAKPVDASELKLRLRNTLTLKAYVDQLSSFDALTKLANRKSLREKMSWALKLDQLNENKTALLSVGLDRFGQVNESFGIQFGDVLLYQVAQRINDVVASRNKLLGLDRSEAEIYPARLAGDEFGVLIPSVNGRNHAASIARQIIAGISKPFNINGKELFVNARIGITVAPDDGLLSDELINTASTAMRQSKVENVESVRFYSQTNSHELKEKIELETALHKALENNELLLHYQPKVDLLTRKVRAAEALIRWQHPEKGMISPVVFIPLAEESGLILDIGDWVLNEACRQAAEWERSGLGDIEVSVNVSGPQFQEANYKAHVETALKASGLSPSLLMLELTESLAMHNVEASVKLLSSLKELGIGLSIDDFGTGYSSLSYLKRFPLDELKVDRSFITGIPDNEDEVRIVLAIIAMAKALRLSVVIEGVETEEQLTLLQGTQSDLIQGFYFSKPLAADDFRLFVEQFNH
ncbi:EAL domain-containing response regulator [Amphritea opalescens]|uniref:cyclic-guanylate-specific phosphodiesterase n=1 Tax=Amphritea opalescens TaxID=2490544 RepID=A0A430KTB4_9GAMM|nr:EAL domain-containing response regulator [Amphritea opalescens]RTE66720.1 EAL domain-containing response regulator [Amphritea opalescens]